MSLYDFASGVVIYPCLLFDHAIDLLLLLLSVVWQPTLSVIA